MRSRGIAPTTRAPFGEGSLALDPVRGRVVAAGPESDRPSLLFARLLGSDDFVVISANVLLDGRLFDPVARVGRIGERCPSE